MAWQIRKPKHGAVPAEEHQSSPDDQRLVTVGDAGAFTKRDKHTELKVELHQRLLDLINLSALDNMSREQIEAEVGDVIDELLGLGPLEPLLKDPTITDILVNGANSVFIERYGQLEHSPVRFKDDR